jgi:hypothetical protein
MDSPALAALLARPEVQAITLLDVADDQLRGTRRVSVENLVAAICSVTNEPLDVAAFGAALQMSLPNAGWQNKRGEELVLRVDSKAKPNTSITDLLLRCGSAAAAGPARGKRAGSACNSPPSTKRGKTGSAAPSGIVTPKVASPTSSRSTHDSLGDGAAVTQHGMPASTHIAAPAGPRSAAAAAVAANPTEAQMPLAAPQKTPGTSPEAQQPPPATTSRLSLLQAHAATHAQHLASQQRQQQRVGPDVVQVHLAEPRPSAALRQVDAGNEDPPPASRDIASQRSMLRSVVSSGPGLPDGASAAAAPLVSPQHQPTADPSSRCAHNARRQAQRYVFAA